MDTLSLLKKVPAFRGLPEIDLKWLEEKGELQPLGKNVMLFGADDTLDFMLIVLEGGLLLKKEDQPSAATIPLKLQVYCRIKSRHLLRLMRNPQRNPPCSFWTGHIFQR